MGMGIPTTDAGKAKMEAKKKPYIWLYYGWKAGAKYMSAG